MIDILVKWREGSCEVSYDHPVSAEDVLKEVRPLLPYDVINCLVDNVPHRLSETLDRSCTLTFLDIRTHEANVSYQASLSLVYIKAVHDVLGKTAKVKIENSLSKGYYTTISTRNLTEEKIRKIEKRMHTLIEMDLPIEIHHLSRDEILEILASERGDQQGDLLAKVPHLQEAEVYTLSKESALFFTHLVPRTGYLKNFELRKYKRGVLLRFASNADPESIPEYVEDELMYKAFAEEKTWNQLLGITYTPELNARMLEKDYKNLVLLSEALQEKKIAELAAAIAREKKHIVLIAGPSSSGKTTFSKRLMIQLQVNGLKPLYLGTDDYFVEREDTPIGPDGKPNFEDLEAVDVKLFENQLNALLRGEEVDIPVFDFVDGHKHFGTRIVSGMEKNRVIVIEGIHALNPAMCPGVDEEEKYRIYISPLTQLNIDGYNRVATTEARMLRRIVRDNQFRAYPAKRTIAQWPSVRAGEDKNIFPFSKEADAFFNSHLIYELAVLKKYAEPLLEEITPEEEEYAMARRLLNMLKFIVAMDDDSIIPPNSIMREFIGGSILAEE